MNNYFITIMGILVIMAVGAALGLYYIQRGNERIDTLDKKFNGFIDKWDQRIKFSNNMNNGTQTKLNDILDKQIRNEENILGNLTRHRLVANDTNDRTFEIQKQLHADHIKVMEGLNRLGANITLPENNITGKQFVENKTEIINLLKQLVK